MSEKGSQQEQVLQQEQQQQQQPPLQNLPKHHKYQTSYKKNEVYWGLGVEHETYLETSKLKKVTLKELKENQKAERYCVDYLTVYTKDLMLKALDGLFEEDKPILIPILANSHTFQKTDLNGEHMTTYTRIPKPNPNFNGQTLFDWLCKENPDIFRDEYDKSFIFDGDTIEFMTQKFYKATVYEVMHELRAIEKDFIKGLNCLPREGILKTYAPFKIIQENYPFASYLTNLKNNAMFNNGTIHINVTLPTRLDVDGKIADFVKFTEDHRKLAKALQWMSPIMIAKYGAYDPLCESKYGGEKYAAGSQRLAVSRYIGLGSFDTDEMPLGKILTVPVKSLKNIDWYYEFHKKADYKFLDEIGLDINFNKHYSHGLEFRILESLPYEDINNILDTIIYLADFSADVQLINPKKSSLWHKITEKCVLDGKGYKMDVYEQNELFTIFKCMYDAKEPQLASDVYDLIAEDLKERYKDAKYARCMIKGFDYEEEKQVEPYDHMADYEEDNSVVPLVSKVDEAIHIINKNTEGLHIIAPSNIQIYEEEPISSEINSSFTVTNICKADTEEIKIKPVESRKVSFQADVSTTMETKRSFMLLQEIMQPVLSEVPLEAPLEAHKENEGLKEEVQEKIEEVQQVVQEKVEEAIKTVELVIKKRKWCCF
jgi:hypothetical protein